MRDDEEDKRRRARVLAVAACIAVLIMLPALMPSCRTVQSVQTRDSVRVELRRDTLLLTVRDSVYITEKAKDDTIYITKTVERWRTRDKIVERIDTLTNTVTLTETVTVTKSNKFTLGCTIALWVLVAAAIALGAVKVYRKFRI